MHIYWRPQGEHNAPMECSSPPKTVARLPQHQQHRCGRMWAAVCLGMGHLPGQGDVHPTTTAWGQAVLHPAPSLSTARFPTLQGVLSKPQLADDVARDVGLYPLANFGMAFRGFQQVIKLLRIELLHSEEHAQSMQDSALTSLLPCRAPGIPVPEGTNVFTRG